MQKDQQATLPTPDQPVGPTQFLPGRLAVLALGLGGRRQSPPGKHVLQVKLRDIPSVSWRFWRVFSRFDCSLRIGQGVARLRGLGNVFADFDKDGWLDLFTANSHVNDLAEDFESFAYRQSKTVSRNLSGSFGEAVDVGAVGTHRGAAVADFDADGRLDVVVSALGEPAKLFRNVSEQSHA